VVVVLGAVPAVGVFLLVYFDTIVSNRLVSNVVGILVGVALHAVVVGTF
jgi:hypothetical protein